jgi:hypothetical protein
MSALPKNQNQIPDHSILDLNGKQIYLENGYVASIDTITLANTTESAVMLLTNPAANKVALFNYLSSAASLTSGNSVTFKFYYNPTITGNGTALTPVNLRYLSANTSVMTAFKSPTISSNGTYLYSIQANFGQSTDSKILSILDPGKSLLVTATASANSTAFTLSRVWNEL